MLANSSVELMGNWGHHSGTGTDAGPKLSLLNCFQELINEGENEILMWKFVLKTKVSNCD